MKEPALAGLQEDTVAWLALLGMVLWPFACWLLLFLFRGAKSRE